MGNSSQGDVLLISWRGDLRYALPPISLLPQVRCKICRDRPTILITPFWPHLFWFMGLFRLSARLPLHLHVLPNLLTQDHDRVLHLNLGPLHLMVWFLMELSHRRNMLYTSEPLLYPQQKGLHTCLLCSKMEMFHILDPTPSPHGHHIHSHPPGLSLRVQNVRPCLQLCLGPSGSKLVHSFPPKDGCSVLTHPVGHGRGCSAALITFCSLYAGTVLTTDHLHIHKPAAEIKKKNHLGNTTLSLAHLHE